MSATTFAAKYASPCAECSTRIQPGDEILFGEDDQVQHAECPDEPDDSPADICGRCYMAIPLTGICDNCEDD